MKLAGIDIGSNAIRLLVNDIMPGKNYKKAILKKTAYVRLPLRLGGDVFKYGKIREQKVEMFIKAMRVYKQLMEFYEVEDFRACATSATRSAENGEEIIKRIEEETGIKIDVIDGTEESELLFETNIYNLPEGKTFISADLGGGSLQVTLFENNEMIWTHSYKIGTVRFLNGSVDPQEFVKLKTKMKELAKEYKQIHLIGSGGNINKISKMVGEKTVELKDIQKLHKELASLSVEERIHEFELRPDRADVIVPASEIYINLMKDLDVKKIFVPKIGLADGVIRQLYEQKTNTKK